MAKHVDAGACLPRDLDKNKSQKGQQQEALPSQIQALFSFLNSQINIVFGSNFRDDPMIIF